MQLASPPRVSVGADSYLGGGIAPGGDVEDTLQTFAHRGVPPNPEVVRSMPAKPVSRQDPSTALRPLTTWGGIPRIQGVKTSLVKINASGKTLCAEPIRPR